MFSAPPKKYVHEVPALSPPRNMYLGGTGVIRNYATLPSTKKSYITIQTVVLTFSVLLCIFSCFLTVTLSYKWHTDTNAMIGRLEGTVGELVRDINTLTNLLKEIEIAARRVSNLQKEEPKNDKDENNYEDLEDADYDENKFMDKDLLDNTRPTKNIHNDSHKVNNRRRRNAEIETAIKMKNELNSFSSNNEKSRAELLEEESTTEENTVIRYNRKPKKMAGLRKKTVMESEDLEDFKETTQIVAAHFYGDPSRYSTKLHAHYDGNGRLKHPDGDFRDWTNCTWNTDLDSNNILLKNGKVEILKPGLFYVYAQVYYSDQHDINGYYIMKNDEKVIGCTSTRHRETQSDSCYTGGLIYFNSHDILSIKGLDTERYIILDNVKTFFGLFKVSKERQQR